MAYKTITIVGSPTKKEFDAGAAITPGHLLYLASDGDVEAHATAGGTAAPWFALEDDLRGREIGTAYTADNRVQTGIFSPGDEVYALLADGEDAAIGSYVESKGTGELRVVDTDSGIAGVGIQSVVGVAMEAVNLTASAVTAAARIRIMII